MQNANTSCLSKSLAILHSSFFLILLSGVLHVLYVDPPAVFFYFPFGVVLLKLFLIATKLFADGGIFGTIIELAGTQRPATSRAALKANAVRYWRYYALLQLGLFLVTMLLSGAFYVLNLPFKGEHVFLDLVVLYLLAQHIIKTKYLAPLHIDQRTIPVGRRDILFFGILFLFNIIIVNARHLMAAQGVTLTNELVFLHTYFRLLAFTYIAVLILSRSPEIEQAQNHEHEIYLINPLGGGIIQKCGTSLIGFSAPVFVTLKALTPAKYVFKEFNSIVWRKRFYRGGKLVAITTMTSNCAEAYKIAKEFRRRGSTVIMGGPHVTYLPEEALRFCDAVVIGEVENVWAQVIADYENNQLKRRYVCEACEGFSPAVQQRLLNEPPSVVKNFLETTRGCKYACHFCAVPQLSGGKLRCKPVADVVELVKIVASRHRAVLFLDNNIIADRGHAEALFRALIPLGIHWASQCSIDIAEDDELLSLAKKSGCMQLLIGYEIAAESNEKSGKFALANRYVELSKKIKRAGIGIKAHFILGFESDDTRTLLQMWTTCFKIMPVLAVVSVLTPIPGAQLFYKLLRADRIVNLNWRYYGFHNLVFEHPVFGHQRFHIYFTAIFALCFFTASLAGLLLSAVILADAYFFGLRHFLF